MPFDEGGSTSPWPSLILNITCGLGKRDIREVGLNASISAPNVRGDTTGNTRPDPADLGNSTDWRKKQPSVGGAGTYEGRKGEGNTPHVKLIIVSLAAFLNPTFKVNGQYLCSQRTWEL